MITSPERPNFARDDVRTRTSMPEKPVGQPCQTAAALMLGEGVKCSRFRGTNGGEEFFISVVPAEQGDLQKQIREVERGYARAQQALGLDEKTAIFRRIFVSDAVNNAETVRASRLMAQDPANPVAVSLVEQPPLPQKKIALLAYHITEKDQPTKQRIAPHSIVVRKNGARHVWTTGLCSHGRDRTASPFEQTRQVFADLIGTLGEKGATLRDHCLRTWLYVRDVDIFYAGMVAARGITFAQNEMSGDTHFIASTGIEGACADPRDVILMDAYSNLDLQPRQLSFLNDYESLCEARDYNVHFERASRVDYSDRSQIFVSGTASIDKNGLVVHQGSVVPQLERALANVEGLLRAGSAELSDMMHLIVYLRDPADYACVQDYLRERFPALPTVIVQGAVCRPEWLIEVEGIAVRTNDDPSMPQF